MGAAASMEDAVGIASRALGDRVTRDGCRELSRLLRWSGDVEAFIDLTFDADDETISKEKALRKVAKAGRKHDEKEGKKDILKNKGETTYRAALSQQGVDGLSALPADLRNCIVPCDSEEGKELATRALALMNELESCFAATGDFSDEVYNAFEEVPPLIQRFFTRRIQLYERTCTDGAAVAEIRALLIALGCTYREMYEPIFNQQLIADREGFIAFQEYANAKQKKLGQRIEACVQSATKLHLMYYHALSVQKLYRELCASVAAATGGQFRDAPIKGLLRTIEKSAARHDKDRRFVTDGVMDLVRGALVYHSFAGLLRGLQALFESDKFEVLRMKDRFATPTDAGWRDVVINGRLRADRQNQHTVEIQLHYAPLVTVREDLGGHFIYAKQRALAEALEIVGVAKAAAEEELGAGRGASAAKTGAKAPVASGGGGGGGGAAAASDAAAAPSYPTDAEAREDAEAKKAEIALTQAPAARRRAKSVNISQDSMQSLLRALQTADPSAVLRSLGLTPKDTPYYNRLDGSGSDGWLHGGNGWWGLLHGYGGSYSIITHAKRNSLASVAVLKTWTY